MANYTNQDLYLAYTVEKRLRQRGLADNLVYVSRAKEEFDIFVEMGFSRYFLVVMDFIDAAKAMGIPCGPGRGSGAGCLVTYLLGITLVDPIKYDLHFERFLNPGRGSQISIEIREHSYSEIDGLDFNDLPFPLIECD